MYHKFTKFGNPKLRNCSWLVRKFQPFWRRWTQLEPPTSAQVDWNDSSGL